MQFVNSVYVKLLSFNGLNKSFVSIVNISLSPSICLNCDCSIATSVTRFSDCAI